MVIKKLTIMKIKKCTKTREKPPLTPFIGEENTKHQRRATQIHGGHATSLEVKQPDTQMYIKGA